MSSRGLGRLGYNIIFYQSFYKDFENIGEHSLLAVYVIVLFWVFKSYANLHVNR